AVACFIALIITLLALLAWSRPVCLFGETLCTPLDARVFIGSGIAGAIVIPAFCLFCSLLLGFEIQNNAWFYIISGSYSFSSIFITAKFKADAYDLIEETSAPVATHNAPLSLPEPFRYADWTDEVDAEIEEKPAC